MYHRTRPEYFWNMYFKGQILNSHTTLAIVNMLTSWYNCNNWDPSKGNLKLPCLHPPASLQGSSKASEAQGTHRAHVYNILISSPHARKSRRQTTSTILFLQICSNFNPKCQQCQNQLMFWECPKPEVDGLFPRQEFKTYTRMDRQGQTQQWIHSFLFQRCFWRLSYT